MTVNLTRIYTKLGDGGETHLGDMSRVSKLDSRVEAYGTVDELNATLGVALLRAGPPAGLRRVAAPRAERPARPRRRPVGARAAAGDAHLRARPSASGCASAPPTPSGSSMPATRSTPRSQPLRSFVIPGGTPAAAHLHVCRTVCRRAERRAIAVGEEVNPEVVRYLNRLSDLLFILSRAANDGPSAETQAEPLWDPGTHRANTASQSA